MFKIGIITDEVSQDLETALKLAADHGLQGVEIRSVNEKNPFSFSREDAEEILHLVNSYGLGICGISAPFYKCDMENAAEVAEHLRGLENCIRLAKLWGCSIIRGFTFWRLEDRAERLDEIAAHFTKPIEMLQEAGLRLALESDPSVNASTGAELSEILARINSPQVTALWDPGNSVYAPVPEVPYPDGYGKIREHVSHVHIKDARRVSPEAGAEVKGVNIGEGEVDFAGQLRALAGDGYQGWLVLEPHWRLETAISDELLKRPGGSDFSEGGYEPSRLSIVALQEIVKQLGL